MGKGDIFQALMYQEQGNIRERAGFIWPSDFCYSVCGSGRCACVWVCVCLPVKAVGEEERSSRFVVGRECRKGTRPGAQPAGLPEVWAAGRMGTAIMTAGFHKVGGAITWAMSWPPDMIRR